MKLKLFLLLCLVAICAAKKRKGKNRGGEDDWGGTGAGWGGGTGAGGGRGGGKKMWESDGDDFDGGGYGDYGDGDDYGGDGGDYGGDYGGGNDMYGGDYGNPYDYMPGMGMDKGNECPSKRMENLAGTCYFVSDFPTTYTRAKAFCESIDAVLLDITDKRDNSFAQILLAGKKAEDDNLNDGLNSAWVDITKQGSKWKLPDMTEATHVDWADGQPNVDATKKTEEGEMTSFEVKKRSSDSDKNKTECVILKWTEDLPEFMWYSTACYGNVPRYFVCKGADFDDEGQMQHSYGGMDLGDMGYAASGMGEAMYDGGFDDGMKKKKKSKKDKDKKDKKKKDKKDKKNKKKDY